MTASVNEPVLIVVAYYGYDPRWRRVVKILPAATEWYAYDGWRETDKFDAAFQARRTILPGAQHDERLGYAVASQNGWVRYTYIQDERNSVRQVIDPGGTVVEKYQYDPYGRRTVYDTNGQSLAQTQVDNDAGFSGHVHDQETGLAYARHRYYSPHTGRFLTNDPVGVWRDIASQGNAYAYAGSRPQGLRDPFGLYTIVVVVRSADADMNATNSARAEDLAKKDPDGGEVITVDFDKDGKPKEPETKTYPPKKDAKKEGEKESESKEEEPPHVEVLIGHGRKVDVKNEKGTIVLTYAVDGEDRAAKVDIVGLIEAALTRRNPPGPPNDPGGKVSDPGVVMITTCYLALGPKPDDDLGENKKNREKNTGSRIKDKRPKWNVKSYDCFMRIPPNANPPIELIEGLNDSPKLDKKDNKPIPAQPKPVK